MWNRIIALVWKELLSVWRDPKIRSSLLIPPVIQLFIFTFAATLDVKNVPIGILNLDNGRQSIELVQRFHGSPTFSQIVYLQSYEQIAPFIDNQKGVMVLSINDQFSRHLDAGKPTDVQLILDGRKSNTAQIVAGYASSIISQFNQEYASSINIKPPSVQLVPRNWFNPNLLYYWYNVPSLVVIISMLTSLLVTSMSVSRERELGTFDQLLVSPLRPIEILMGKIIPGIIVGMLESLLILTVGVLLFQVPFVGSILIFFFSLFVFVCCIVGMGLFISSLSATQQQSTLGNFFFITPSILLAGFATPIENMPTWLQPFTYLIPLRYMLIISKGIFLKDISFGVVFNNIWPMMLIALFTLSAAVFLFRRRLE